MQISKAAWYPAELAEKAPYGLTENTFNLHIEPQWNVLSENLNFYLHYEINPYCDENWARKNLPEQDLDRFLQRRNRFIELLKEKAPAHWNVYGYWNQVAKWMPDLEGVKVRDFVQTASQEIARIESVCDDILKTIYEAGN